MYACCKAVCPFFCAKDLHILDPQKWHFFVLEVFMCVCWKRSTNSLHIVLYRDYPKKKHSLPLIATRHHSRIHMPPPTSPLPPLRRCLAGTTIHYTHWLNSSTAWQSNSLAFLPSLQNAHFFHFCKSACIIIFANLQVVGAKKQKCAELQIRSTHKWKSGTPYYRYGIHIRGQGISCPSPVSEAPLSHQIPKT